MQITGMRPDVIRSIQHRWLLKCWSDARLDRIVPTWDQLQPEDLARSHDTFIVVDVVGTLPAARFRIDFQGRRITEIYGHELQGRFMDETLPPTIRDATLALYRHAATEACPVYTISEYRDVEGHEVHHERLLLPFGGAGNSVVRVLASIEALSPDGGFEHRGLLRAPAAPRYLLCAAIELHQP